jgi:hypothetical protein
VTLYSPDHRSAMRAAVRHGRSGDALHLALLPARIAVYRWKRRFRGGPPPRPLMPPVDHAPVDVDAVIARAARPYRVELPPPRPDPNTFRAAGARRLPWPAPNILSSDEQDPSAWHRLYWALEGIDAIAQTELVAWLDRAPDALASHPYNTSERIRTIAELLATSSHQLEPALRERLVVRLRADAAWLARHVEYHLGVQNHLLNNARALYAAGALLAGEPEAEQWVATARALWDEYWPKLILDDGVFAEQSTHYHVLLTRTLLEYITDAHTSGRALSPEMVEKGYAMAEVTNLLVRRDGTLPLFGHISPDHPTAWLRGIPLACARAGLLDAPPRDGANGYAGGASALARDASPAGRAGGEAHAPTRLRESGHAGPAPIASRPEGWTVWLFRTGGLLVALHPARDLELAAHGDPRPHTACHGDTGRGTYEIWHRGRRVVVDGGVPTYEPCALRDRFHGAEGQNVVAVDHIAPAVLPHAGELLPSWYVESIAGGTWQADAWSATFTWRGFGRCHPGLLWRRTWRWSDDEIIVEDALEGWSGDAFVETWLHFGEPVWRAGAGGTVFGPGCTVRYAGPPAFTPALGSMRHCTDYGAVVEAQGLHARARMRLPASWRYSFTFAHTGS